ncbi:hypothetical protein D3C84_549420 [compost metagenome]
MVLLWPKLMVPLCNTMKYVELGKWAWQMEYGIGMPKIQLSNEILVMNVILFKTMEDLLV